MKHMPEIKHFSTNNKKKVLLCVPKRQYFLLASSNTKVWKDNENLFTFQLFGDEQQ